ncbi:MAG: oligopeptide transporter, OPT family [Acidobacteria bacterium]|nr:oligopeptide transporter, OPT family [Acidobacteriota bacterium]
MSHDAPPSIHGLPENARRELGPGEVYIPLVPGDGVPEITLRSLALGGLFCAVFSMAAAYLALKVGQGIEAAIPIAILAIGLGRLFTRRSSILENVIATSIGANSSHVVAGAVFTIPALYMLAGNPAYGLPQPSIFQIITVSFLGGCLGILFLIPLRYHFMVENHGVFPWPEATATTEILVTGEAAGNQAKILAGAAGIGALYDGLATLFRGMGESITLRHVWVGSQLREKFLAFNFLNSAATLGIGYILGLRYTAVIAAGSFLSMFVLVPLIHAIGQHAPGALPPGALPIAQMSPEQVFRSYVRIVGVGAIAGAGIMGVLASLPSMIRSIRSNLEGLKHQDGRAAEMLPRPERSLPLSFVGVGLLLFALAAFLFFSFGIGLKGSLVAALAATLLVMAIAFLFAPVAARAIATIGTNPISGMTMLTLIITGFVMLRMGLGGGPGAFVTMMVGGVVCTALSASGAFSTDLKIGHWIGATPARQMGLKFFGTFVAAVFCGLAMWLLSKQGFGTTALSAPQASAMKEILEGIFGSTTTPLRWYLFGLGVALSLVLRLAEVPALGFALGMYLPMELNTPLALGGLLSHLVNKPRADVQEGDLKARENSGILIASGLMAGGALMGVFSALVFLVFEKLGIARERLWILSEHAYEGALGEWLGLLAMAALCIWTVAYSRRAQASR